MSTNVFSLKKVQTTITGYTVLDYIESSGTQYIDTGVPFKGLNKLVFEFYKVNNSVSTESKGWGAFSSLTNCVASGGRINTSTGNLACYSANSNWDYSPSISASDSLAQHYIETLELGNGWISGHLKNLDTESNSTFYGVSSTWTPSFTTTNNIYIFKDSGETYPFPSATRCYSFKLYDSAGTLIRNMIAVKRDSDSVLGLYDLVNETFYTNAGTGTFTAGPVTTLSNSFTLALGGKDQVLNKDGLYCNVPITFGSYTQEMQDYVIESNTKTGTNGSIPYKAHWVCYASGKKEIWINYTIPSISGSSWGKSYYLDYSGLGIPADTIGFSKPPQCIGAMTQDKQWSVYNRIWTTHCRFLRPGGNYTSTNVVVALHFIGE